MTRLPMDSRAVTGVDGPSYDLNAICAAPGCRERAVDAHHIWRRSAVGNHAWVESEMWEGKRGNLVGLCRNHHHQLTVNAAWLRFDPEEGAFWWTTMLDPPRRLEWSPPFEVVELEVTHSPLGELALDGEPMEWREDKLEPRNPEICPSCKRPLPHVHKGSREARRPRRTWSVTVPVDERENGADVLDTLLEASRDLMARAGMPYGEAETTRYFVLTAALGLFVQGGLMGDA